MSFQLCPIDGHNFHGLAESTIHLIQTAFKIMQLAQHRLHATGLWTVLKLIQNDLNTAPYGYTLPNAQADFAKLAVGWTD